MEKRGCQLEFISRINKDGSGTEMVTTTDDLSFLNNVKFDLMGLSMTLGTYIVGHNFCYVVRIKEDEWKSVERELPDEEGYYGVTFDNGETDELRFRIRSRKNIHGFMSERDVTHWRYHTDPDDFEID